MRTFIVVLLVAINVSEAVWAQDLPELPIDSIIEDEVSDVEVCQDFICSKLREEILIEAAKCRPLASFKRRRMRVRRSRARDSCKLFGEKNFTLSKGKCSAAIRSASERAGVDADYLAMNAYDLHKRGMMEKAGFVNMIWKYDETTAPLGSVLIYVGGVGHRYGHVEVRANPSLFCSDHCNDKPVSAVNRGTQNKYKLVGVYLPFPSSIQLTSTTRPQPPIN
ncbi:MAG: hypothetical protein AB7G93_05510 [Bdellovibrionales bacterium]